MKKYRNEWKFCCSEEELAMLSLRICPILEPDPHGDENGKYEIHSLYFDDYRDSCAADNEASAASRFKYRIRYYGGMSDLLFLERKEKLYGRCHKDSCRITPEQYEALVSGDVGELLYGECDPLVKRFASDILTRRFTPKVIIDYDRVAYVETISNIRITFDTNISASFATDEFRSGDYIRMPLQQKARHVLEVKFDEILPGHIKNMIYSSEFQQTTFSKYYLGRRCLEGVSKCST